MVKCAHRSVLEHEGDAANLSKTYTLCGPRPVVILTRFKW